MFIRFDGDRITVHTTNRKFRRKSALERTSNENWVRIMKETVAVERRMAQLQRMEKIIYAR